MIASRAGLAFMLAGCSFQLTPSEKPMDGPSADSPGDASVDVPLNDAPIDMAPPTTCSPNVQQCFGHALETCNAMGTGFDQAQQVMCPLTCSGTACVAASNLSTTDQLMCGATSPALSPPAGATVTLAAGQITCSPNCGAPGVTSISRSGTSPHDWYCLSAVNLDATVTLNVTRGQSAVSWFVVDAVTIAKDIDFTGANATGDLGGGSDLPGAGGPGGFSGGAVSQNDADGNVGLGSCGGSAGTSVESGGDAAGGGGGGGGHRAAGASGGIGRSNNGGTQANAGAGGAATCNNPDGRPLIGGSGGGGGGDGGCGSGVACGWPGGGGGGAFQIASRVAITVTSTLNASGGNGAGETTEPGGGGGGGAGGLLLLEAPTLNVTGQLRVDGGSGGTSSAGPGGAGAMGSNGPAPGAGASADDRGGGGGGGAAGHVRLNATTGASCSTSSPTGSCSTGALLAMP